MGDDDGSADEANFPLFQWDMNSETESTESNEDAIIRNNADLLQKLSQLEMDEVGDIMCGSDLPSVMRRIDSPFLFQPLCNNKTNGTKKECYPDDNAVKSRSGCIICNMIDLRQKDNAVRHYMGSMAQCRGAGGDALREAGAIHVLLGILWRLICPLQIQNSNNVNSDCSSIVLLPTMASEPLHSKGDMKFDLENLCDNHQHLRNNNPSFDGIVMNQLDMTALDLAISCLGSLRDLACGSALNRAALLEWTHPSTTQYGTHCIENGVHILSAYVKRYDQWKWEDILSLNEQVSNRNSNATAIDSTENTDRGKKELRLLTNALGTIRNASHSTPDVCQEFFNHGLVDPLVWRLMPDAALENPETTMPTKSSLPDASRPWREACFRSAASLINLAEKCPDVAYQLGSNRRLLYLLIETWGGANAITFDPNKANSSTRGLPLLHLGLAAILNAAGNKALQGGLDDVMVQVLEKENMRKRVAQRKEEERKRLQTKQK
mmetsp:Transcript_12693/g.22839  ORF Transcript_12693/g.22839 Transcript_12693/m.22839 type:complete len:493 (-) Transcript_12693:30-1508(-)